MLVFNGFRVSFGLVYVWVCCLGYSFGLMWFILLFMFYLIYLCTFIIRAFMCYIIVLFGESLSCVWVGGGAHPSGINFFLFWGIGCQIGHLWSQF